MLFYDVKLKLALLEELNVNPTYEVNVGMLLINKKFGKHAKDVIVWLNIKDYTKQKIQSLTKTNDHWKDIFFEYNENNHRLELQLTEEFKSYLLEKNTKYLLTQNIYKSIQSQLCPASLETIEMIELHYGIINPIEGIQLDTSRSYNKDIISHYNLEVIDTDKDNIKFLKIKDEEQAYTLLLIENKFLGTKI